MSALRSLELASSMVFLLAIATGSSARAQCGSWERGFAGPGFDLPPSVFCNVASPQIGAGLYVGGRMTDAGSHAIDHIVRWTGTAWTVLGSGVDGPVHALCEHDDGSGTALFVGGLFGNAAGESAPHIARWNGVAWSALGSGMNGPVDALCSYDDGTGPALYAGGSFTQAGGATASYIARWNGTSWSALGLGVDAPVLALSAYDDGTGSKLYVGGSFTHAGGIAANYIARWDGSSWSTLTSGGQNGTDNWVRALCVHDDGAGPKLFAAGNFAHAGNLLVEEIASWDGAVWSNLGTANLDGPCYALTSWGNVLVAGGLFNNAGQNPAKNVAQWNGAVWSPLTGGTLVSGQVQALAAASDGSLYAGGQYSGLYILHWTGAGWSPVGPNLGLGWYSDGEVHGDAFVTHDDGSGPALFVGGVFASAGGVVSNSIAKWNGQHFSALGGGFGSAGQIGMPRVEALLTYDDGGGPRLYAGGQFTTADGNAARNVARWDGLSWNALAQGVGGAGQSWVNALCPFDDGNGTQIYAGGYFTVAGGTSGIESWDGAQWHTLPPGLDGSNPPEIKALVVHDDGSGPALYVGGIFDTINGTISRNVARWNGTSWSTVGGGLAFGEWVRALCTFDDGSGAKLYARTTVGVKRWDGVSWSALGATLGDGYALGTLDDGNGPALCTAGNSQGEGVVRWSGSAWTNLSGGTIVPGSGSTTPAVNALIEFDDGTGRALYTTGNSVLVGGQLAESISRWRVCGPATSFCAGDALDAQVTTACPCGNVGEMGHGCANSVNHSGGLLQSGGSTALNPSTSTDTVVLTASGILSTSVFLQGDAVASAGVVFGDGLRCAAGHLIRLAVKPTINGVSRFPQPGDPSVSQRGGVTIGSGVTRYYQTYYRNPDPLYCPGATFNITNGLIVVWAP